MSDGITIAAGATLDVSPGVTVRCQQYDGLVIDGALNAVGTAGEPVVFTGTGAAPGWWKSLTVQNSGSATCVNCVLEYAGYSTSAGILKTGNGSLTLRDSVLRHVNGDGLRVAAGSASLSSTGNLFSNCTYGVRLGVGASFADNTSDFRDNAVDVYADGGTAGGAVVWRLKPDYSIYLSGSLTVGPTASLTIEPGTVVKFAQNKGLYVDGALAVRGTAGAPVVLTDWRDDRIGGDANHDGDAGAPAPDWWYGVVIRGEADADIRWCEVAYSGWSHNYGLHKSGSGSLRLDRVVCHDIGGDALCFDGSSGADEVRRCTFRDSDVGVLVRNQTGPVALSGCRIQGNSNQGVRNEGSFDVDARGCWWGDPSGPYHAVRNPGGAGNAVSDGVLFEPWLLSDAIGFIIAPIASGTLMQGDALRFLSDPAGNVAGATYTWDLGDGRSSNAVNPGIVSFPATGTYTVTFAVDSGGGATPLTDERTLTVVPESAAPDLVVRSVSIPTSISVGSVATVTYTVENAGDAPLPATSWTDTLFLSRDEFLDATDVPLGSAVQSRALAVGESYAETLHVRVNAVEEGQAYLILAADEGWRLLERHRLNNERAAQTSIGVPVLSTSGPVDGQFAGVTDVRHYYRLDVAAGQSLVLSFSGPVRVYLRFGALPTPRTYDVTGSWHDGGSITIPMAYTGTWYLLVVPEDATAAAAYTLEAALDALLVSGLAPTQVSNTLDAVLTVTGAGFTVGTEVELLPTEGGAAIPAATVCLDSFCALTAAWNAGTLPAGIYRVRVTSEGAFAESTEILTVAAGGEPLLTTRLMLPSRMGYHQLATIYVEYANEGDAPMPAPLLILSATQNGQPGALMTLEDQHLSNGFWTSAIPRGFSNSIALLAGGALAGVLQAGERVRVPVYYAGWQKPWDSFYPPFDFRLGAILADSTSPIDWEALSASMRPGHLDAASWEVLLPVIRRTIGETWGSLVSSLAANAAQLQRLGRPTQDVSVLLGMAFLRAEGVSVDQALIVEGDALAQTADLPLGFARLYPVLLSERLRTGWFGKGWAASWDLRAERLEDGTVVLRGPGLQRVFQPDSRGGYLAGPANSGTLRDAGGGALRLTETDGWQYAFAADGFLTGVTTPRGGSIALTYLGERLHRLTHTDGPWIQLGYGAHERIETITDHLGHETRFTYDGSGTLLQSVTAFDGQQTEYTYLDSANPATDGALAGITHPDGTTVSFQYDDDGHLVEVRNNAGEWLTYSYGATGVVTVADALGRSARIALDERGIPSMSTMPSGRVIGHLAGDNLCLERLQDASGRTWRCTYDSRDNLRGLVDAAGAAASFSHDGATAQVTSSTDANGNRTTYAVDPQGRLTAITDTAGRQRAFAYGPDGALRSDTNRRGQTIDYDGNAEGLLARTTMPDGTVFTYTYDGYGRLLTAEDAEGPITLSYHDDERLSRIEYPGGLSLEYSYDAAGRRTRMRDQDGREVHYHYDAAGRLASLSDESGALLVGYSYDAAGRLARQDCGDGSYSVTTFDADDLATRVAHFRADGTSLARFDYTYDTAGRVRTVSGEEGTWTLTHDQAGNLATAVFTAEAGGDVPDTSLGYEVDAAGNRVATTVNGVRTEHTVNVLNQYTRVGDADLAYDQDGNLTLAADGLACTYDAAGRLRRAQKGDDAWEWTYNALGQMATATVNGQKTRFVHDPFDQGMPVGAYGADDSFQAFYVHGLELAAVRRAGASPCFYHYDALGNTTEMTSGPAGAAVNRYRYDPFGRPLVENEAVPNPFRFGGYAGVPSFPCGLIHMGARDYLPELGRFLQPDPIGIGGGMNLYAYAGNQPLEYDDPTGFYTGNLGAMPPVPGIDPRSGAGLEWVKNQFTQQALYSSKPYTGCGRGYQVVQNVAQKGQWVNGRFIRGATQAKRAAQISRFSAAVKAKRAQEAVTTARNGATAVRTATSASGAAGSGGAAAGGASAGGLGVAGAASLALTIWSVGTGVVYGVGYLTGSDTIMDAGGAMWDAMSPSGIAVAYEYYFGDSESVQSEDPNRKTGPAGYGTEGWIRGDGLFAYRIDFENDPSASAPAQVVSVTDPLDGAFDLDTFELTEIGFGDRFVALPAGLQTYAGVIPFEQDGMALEVQVDITLNRTARRLEALFVTIDPESGLPPPVDYGFLPPEDGSGRGQGHLSYVIAPKTGLATGTTLANVAEIVFDFSVSIRTNQIDPHNPGQGTDPNLECRLTLDADAPASQVGPLPTHNPPEFTIAWSGTDAGSGVAGYTVYVQDNGGPFALWTTTEDTSATFTGTAGHTYGFYTEATDHAGNRESKPAVAETTTEASIHTVTFASSGPGGTLQGELAQTVQHGSDASPVEAVPSPEYVLDHWTVSGRGDTAANPLTVTAVTGDLTATAVFRPAGAVLLTEAGTFEVSVSGDDAMAGRGFWDFSGSYAADILGGQLTLDFAQDTKGKIAVGTATYTLPPAGGKPAATITMPIKGKVKGANGVVTVALSMKGATQDKSASAAFKAVLELDPFSGRLEGPVSVKIKSEESLSDVVQVSLPLPVGMDGSWSLRLEFDTPGKGITGTAWLTLSNGVSYHFLIKGKPAGIAVALGLKGHPDDLPAKGIKMKTTVQPLEGGWADILSVSAKGLGQTVAW
ncbi:MAG: hypothetical protein JXR77_16810 [Lentisphaeria bacterium]|nr:hypothetical protein [Lentisphaeria bacterium]